MSYRRRAADRGAVRRQRLEVLEQGPLLREAGDLPRDYERERVDVEHLDDRLDSIEQHHPAVLADDELRRLVEVTALASQTKNISAGE